MIQLAYEMTYRETIEGPLPSTKGSPFGERLCRKIAAGTLVGPRIHTRVAMPGMDWMRLGTDGIRRQGSLPHSSSASRLPEEKQNHDERAKRWT